MIYAMPVIAAGIGGWIGWWLIRDRKWSTFLWIMAAGLVTFALMIFTARQMTGLDGVGRIVIAVIGVLPFQVGMMIGAGIIAVRHRMGRK